MQARDRSRRIALALAAGFSLAAPAWAGCTQGADGGVGGGASGEHVHTAQASGGTERYIPPPRGTPEGRVSGATRGLGAAGEDEAAPDETAPPPRSARPKPKVRAATH